MSSSLMLHGQAFSHFPHIPPPRPISLVTLPPHQCSYLPDRETMLRAALVERLEPATYHAFMDAGFRRSGTMLYQPVCVRCRQCIQLRVPVATFAPTRSQRRTARQNTDVVLTVRTPTPTREKFEMYSRYCAKWHGHDEPETAEGFIRFLYDSPVQTAEFEYRVDGRLVGVGICDVSERSLSSVYFYFEPDEARRSLGTYSVLREIDFCRDRGIPHWYAGYWVPGCGSMAYKASFGPAEILGMDGTWRPLGQSELPSS